MHDLARLDRAHVGRVEGHDGNGIAAERRKVNLIPCTLLMRQHDMTAMSVGVTRLGAEFTC